MEFADFPFPDTAPSYPQESSFYKYLRKFTKDFDLEKYIRVCIWHLAWGSNYLKTD